MLLPGVLVFVGAGVLVGCGCVRVGFGLVRVVGCSVGACYLVFRWCGLFGVPLVRAVWCSVSAGEYGVRLGCRAMWWLQL